MEEGEKGNLLWLGTKYHHKMFVDYLAENGYSVTPVVYPDGELQSLRNRKYSLIMLQQPITSILPESNFPKGVDASNPKKMFEYILDKIDVSINSKSPILITLNLGIEKSVEMYLSSVINERKISDKTSIVELDETKLVNIVNKLTKNS